MNLQRDNRVRPGCPGLTVRLLWSMLALLCVVPELRAQQVEQQRRGGGEALTLDLDTVASKKLATIENHLRASQFAEAIDLLRGLTEVTSEKLVPSNGNRYVGARRYAHALVAGLPPAGLALYRQQIDPGLRQVFVTAQSQRDPVLLRKLVAEAYCSSYGDDALWLLGEMAWESGNFTLARNYWRQLIPPPAPSAPGQPVPLLAYPDTDLDAATIRARIILCSLLGGDRERAERERLAFAELYPTANGQLSGRAGTWVSLLDETFAAAVSWRLPTETSGVPTFAGSPARQSAEAPVLDVGGVAWTVALPPYSPFAQRGNAAWAWAGLSFFPVVYGDVVFIGDQQTLWAYDLRTGRPAWGEEGSTDARIFQLPERGDLGLGMLGLERITAFIVGEPRHTLTIAHDRLFARLGPLVPPSETAAARGNTSRIVCLDLVQQGKVVWETLASSLPTDGGPWSFEGAPVVVGPRVFVGVRRTAPQPQVQVVCLEVDTGRILWTRNINGAPGVSGLEVQEISQSLLSYGEGTLFYATQLGTIVALEPLTGQIKWLRPYPRIEVRNWRDVDRRASRSPLPALYHAGNLYVASQDSAELWALDADTGLVRWQREFPDPIQALLGVVEDKLIVSGNHLTALQTRTGDIAWTLGGETPEVAGYGRGLIVGDVIYWPTRENLLLVEHATGHVRVNKALREIHGQHGGHLLLSGGYLLISQPGHLAAFTEFSAPPPPAPTTEMSALSPAAAWEAARRAIQRQDWLAAEVALEQASRVVTEEDRWQGKSLAEALATTRWNVLCRRAELATKAQNPTRAVSLWQQALETAPRPELQLATLIAAATPEARLPPQAVRAFADEIARHPLSRAGPVRFQQQTFASSRHWLAALIEREGITLSTPLDLPPAPRAPAAPPLSTGPLTNLLRPGWERSIASGRVWWPAGLPAESALQCVLHEVAAVECLDLATGETRWQRQLAEPLLWVGYHAGGLALATAHALQVVDPLTGELHWQRSLALPAPLVIEVGQRRLQLGLDSARTPPPTGRLRSVVSCGSQLVVQDQAQRLTGFNGATGEVVWDHPLRVGQIVYGPVPLGKFLLVRSNAPDNWWLLDPINGEPQVVETIAGFEWHTPPIELANRGFILLGTRGEIDSFAPPGPAYWTGSGGRNWFHPQPTTVTQITPPSGWAVGDDLLRVREDRVLERLDGLTGNTLWTTPVGQGLLEHAARRTVVTPTHAVIARASLLQAYRLDDGHLAWTQPLSSAQPRRLLGLGPALLAVSETATPEQPATCELFAADTGLPWQRLPIRGLNGVLQTHLGQGLLLLQSPTKLLALRY